MTKFLKASRLAATALCAAWITAAWSQSLPQIGPADAEFAGVDALARDYLQRYNQPGATLVIAVADRIIYAQGYGWANRERSIPTSPWHEHRLASVSKTVTAAALMKQVELGRVSLDASAWNYIAAAMGVQPADPRVRNITVRQLLTHSWGLDRAVSPDPFGSYYTDAGRTVTTCRDMLRYRLQRMTLDFAPGARYAYNNHGYCWLQVIAELADGRPIAQQISAMMGPEPLSLGRFRIGDVLPSAISDAEVKHYDYAGAPRAAPVPGVYPAPAPATVARPDGNYTLTGYGGAGGFIASPLTLMRFIQRLQGIRQPALLSPATWQAMQTEQPLADGTQYAGLGVQTQQAWAGFPDRVYSFNGNILGTRTAWYSTPRNVSGPKLTIVFMTNGSRVWPGDGMAQDNPFTEIVFPVLTELDRIGMARLGAKPEISSERLMPAGGDTEAYWAEQLFAYAERSQPQLYPAGARTVVAAPWRYRHYPASNSYLAVRDGRAWLWRPAQGPRIQDLGPVGGYLPAAAIWH